MADRLPPPLPPRLLPSSRPRNTIGDVLAGMQDGMPRAEQQFREVLPRGPVMKPAVAANDTAAAGTATAKKPTVTESTATATGTTAAKNDNYTTATFQVIPDPVVDLTSPDKTNGQPSQVPDKTPEHNLELNSKLRTRAWGRGARYQATDRRSAFAGRDITWKPSRSRTLRAIIKKEGDGEYSLTYNLKDLDWFHRIEWAVNDDVESVSVRLGFFQDTKDRIFFGFCVHLDDVGCTNRHAYCYSNLPWNDTMACGEAENLLTYCLSCDLHDFLANPKSSVSVSSVALLVKKVLESDPGASCLVCKKARDVKLWRPSTCSPSCESIFQSWPFAVRISPLTRCDTTLDFLLCALKSATYGRLQSENNLMGFPILSETCPFDIEKVPGIIDSFASMEDITDDQDNANPWIGVHKGSSERRMLLEWIATEFSGCLIKAPWRLRAGTSDLFGRDTTEQFIFLNPRPARYDKFMNNIKYRNEERGTVAFHGTAGNRVFAILADGLKDAKKAGYPVKKAGIFYASEPVKSRYYLRAMPILPWKGSRFEHSLVMFGVELSGPNKPVSGPRGEGRTLDESDVNIRYVFVMPCDVTTHITNVYGFIGGGYGVTGTTDHLRATIPRNQFPERSEIVEKMEEIYRKIHDGRIE